MSVSEAEAVRILSGLKGLGPVTLRKMEDRYGGGFAEVLDKTEVELSKEGWGRQSKVIANWRKHWNRNLDQRWMARPEVSYVRRDSEEYPENLSRLNDAPMGLYCRRSVQGNSGRSVAIVGTRNATGYGRKVTREFVSVLVDAGLAIVSGLALGIDTEAHRVALDSGGKTLAVLGCGLDICYPRENRELMEKIVGNGGVWSEFPFGRRADRQSFPQRNRLVAGIADAVLVVESGNHGGSLITARFAAEQGKSVYVIPGRIDSAASEGCHQLIRDGATLVSNPDQILEDLRMVPSGLQGAWSELAGHALDDLEEPQRGILKSLQEEGSLHPDELTGKLSISSSEVLSGLMMLEMKQRVEKTIDGRYSCA